MKITEIAFSSYAITDVKKAREFYEQTLGLLPSSVYEGNGMAFIEYEIGSHTLAIGKGASAFKPGLTGATVAFEVDDFEGFVKKMKEAKTKFVMEPMDTGACQMVIVMDPDGNQLMIHKRKKK